MADDGLERARLQPYLRVFWEKHRLLAADGALFAHSMFPQGLKPESFLLAKGHD
jgi:hypothetical protein